MNHDNEQMNTTKHTIEFYDEHGQDFYDRTLDIDIGEIRDQFLIYLEPGQQILDAGCGSGRDSLVFIKEGYKVTAIDASETLAKLASDLIDQPVLQTSFLKIDFEDEFDGVWACASILHVKKSEIKEVMERVTRGMKPGGYFYLSFKNGEGEGYQNGRWFNNYTEESFFELIEDIFDLTIEKIWLTPDARPDRVELNWLNVILRKTGN